MECFQTNINRFLPETTFCLNAFAKGKEVLQACQMSKKNSERVEISLQLGCNTYRKWKIQIQIQIHEMLEKLSTEITHGRNVTYHKNCNNAGNMNNKLEMKNTNASTKYKYIKCLRNSGLKYHMVSGMVATVIRNSLRCHKCITSDQSWGRTKRPSSSWSSSLWSSSFWSSSS